MLLGITKETLQLNGTEIEHTRKNIASPSKESVTVNYALTNVVTLMKLFFYC